MTLTLQILLPTAVAVLTLWVSVKINHYATHRRLDPTKLRCPACGNTGAIISFVRLTDGQMAGQPRLHTTCETCLFAWYNVPVDIPKEPVS